MSAIFLLKLKVFAKLTDRDKKIGIRMRLPWVAGLWIMTACGKLISIPGINSRAQSQDSHDSVVARLTASTDRTKNLVTVQVKLLGQAYTQSCISYFPSLTFQDKGTYISTAYIKDRLPGYYFQGKFVEPYVAPFFGPGCDVVMCQPLNKYEFTMQPGLVFLKEDPPMPVPPDYPAQLEKIRDKVDAATYQRLSSLKQLDAYSEVIYRGRYTFSVGGLFQDESCEKPVRAAIDFQY